MKKIVLVSVLSLFMLVGCSSTAVENDEFKIYGFDKNVESKTVVGTVSISKDLSKEEKLNTLFNEIYKNYSDKYKMEIKLRDDNIVELNIINGDEIRNQLSSSAQVEGFIFTFIDSLLQKEYTGDWISGVQVLNNGEIDTELGEGAFEEVYKR